MKTQQPKETANNRLVGGIWLKFALVALSLKKGTVMKPKFQT